METVIQRPKKEPKESLDLESTITETNNSLERFKGRFE
jgi:hypothetical protein